MLRHSRLRHAIVALASFAAGCATSSWRETDPIRSPGPISIPERPVQRQLPIQRFAVGLDNPRGMVEVAGGGLLVALAGTGAGDSGAIVALHDRDRNGRITDDEIKTVLDRQPSANAIDIVRRDEVFGPAALASGGGETMATVAFFGGPSLVYRIDDAGVHEWSKVHGNLNSIAFDSTRGAWYAASSTSDEIIRLRAGKGADRVVKLPTLDRGQDPVPGYLRYDPSGQDLLVSLFSGSVVGEEGGEGDELVANAGKIVRVDPDSGETTVAIDRLTAPTDLEIDRCGRIYVLEMCDEFLDPIETLDEATPMSHGGFRRFSGRLLRVDPRTRTVEVLATGLDAPTNLALGDNVLYVAGGMGTPGRTIPGPSGPTPLVGYIDSVAVDELSCD